MESSWYERSISIWRLLLMYYFYRLSEALDCKGKGQSNDQLSSREVLCSLYLSVSLYIPSCSLYHLSLHQDSYGDAVDPYHDCLWNFCLFFVLSLFAPWVLSCLWIWILRSLSPHLLFVDLFDFLGSWSHCWQVSPSSCFDWERSELQISVWGGEEGTGL